MIEDSSDNPRKSSIIFGYLYLSSEIFGNLRKFFENVGKIFVALGQIFENPRKSLKSGQKSSENRPKLMVVVYVLCCLYNKKNSK